MTIEKYCENTYCGRYVSSLYGTRRRYCSQECGAVTRLRDPTVKKRRYEAYMLRKKNGAVKIGKTRNVVFPVRRFL